MTARDNSFDEGNIVTNEEQKKTLSDTDLRSKDDQDSDNTDEESTPSKITNFRPTKHYLSFKTKSTSAIEIKNSNSAQSYPVGDQQFKEIIQSFQNIKSSATNHFRISDLSAGSSNRNLEDSHTSYRKDLEREITDLKVKLAIAQERADTLQNNYNRISRDNEVYIAKMDEVVEKYEEKKNHCEQLETVVAHLQGKAKEASEVRKMLQEKVDKLEKVNKSTRKHRQEIRELKRDVEGLGMEKQGLKIEIDWLKKQLQTPTQDDVSSLGESSSCNDEVITGIHELLSIPSPSKRASENRRLSRRRSRRLTESKHDDDSSQSQKGFFTPLRLPSFSMIDPPSTPIQHEPQENIPQPADVDLSLDQQVKSSMKSTFLSFFGVGGTETNDLSANKSETEHESDVFVQYQPNSSSRMLLPRRLNETL